ncbi:MAG TPA: V-type ATPase subunit [Thermoanaerobaculia bacterium]
MTHRAYGFARLSAQRSSLLSRDDISALRLTSDPQSSSRAASALAIDTERKRFNRLIARYRAILRCYRDAAPLVRAFLRFHEVENVKLIWRATLRDVAPERWRPSWRDLEDLAEVAIDSFPGVHTLFDVVERLRGTPFEQIAARIYRAHGTDLGAAELEFDHWASMQAVAEIESLDKSESLARQIAEAMVRQRDEEIMRRGVSAYGLSPEFVDAQRALPGRRTKADLPALCRRAFRGQAMSLAPALAYAALAERDYALARALAERGGDSELDTAADAVAGRGGG